MGQYTLPGILAISRMISISAFGSSTFAARCEAGNVKLVRGPWNAAFLDELCVAPSGAHDDQIDAAALAFNKLARPPKKALVA